MASAAESSTTSIGSSSAASLPLQTPTNNSLIRLDSSNYILWKYQITYFLKGCNLEGYVDSTFPCPSHTLNQLRRELTNIRKGNLSMEAYFLKIKRLSDDLAASDNSLLESDLQQIILGGLDTEYDPIVATLTALIDDMEMDEFQAHILTFEMRFDSHNAILQKAHAAQYRSHNNNSRYYRSPPSQHTRD
ncbi:hypothetical protein BVC80_1741g26 [Macleaya cordata]|uniref:Retrotransposon Copia-like N-terminal domain-containing protein n=1 Tax=Macleaya cordata TaxID=56857 RepID=A0A200QKV1_MACCD|nr:hypothetical protein BVC80_1741g26 [Macleaya cordata]